MCDVEQKRILPDPGNLPTLKGLKQETHVGGKKSAGTLQDTGFFVH